MDHNNFPPLEPENSLPDIFPDIPERMAPLEDSPVIEELSFEQDQPVSDVELAEESQVSEIEPDEPIVDEIAFSETVLPEDEPIVPEETIMSEEPVLPEDTAEEAPEDAAPEEDILWMRLVKEDKIIWFY